ncbi:MAG: hydrogen gas-evolving membrane-bound hydrogenase subunit E, partial [Gammaproteobacteria bacterium]
MAGVPLLNGFLSKEMFFAEAAQAGSFRDYRLAIAATVASVFTVAYSIRFIHEVFFGPPPTDLPRTPHEPPHWMRFPVEMLVLACLVVGIIPGITIGPFLHHAAESVLGADTPTYSLAVWHGLNQPMVMSIIALAGGALLYVALQRHVKLGTLEHVPFFHRFDGQRAFERFLVALNATAIRLESLVGTQRLQSQLEILVLVVLAAGAIPLLTRGLAWGDAPPLAPDPVFALLWLIGALCAMGAAWQAKYHRLAALTLLAGAGIVNCISFAWLSAPDLALTQLMVEAVTMILILLGLRWLPARKAPRDLGLAGSSFRARLRRARDLGVAVAAGGGMAVLAYAVLTRPFPQTIASFFLERSLPEAGGGNVVNVLLVDFRGFDTLGEITVLAIVSLSVYALLRRFRPAAESIPLPAQQQYQRARGSELDVPPGADGAAGYLLVPSASLRALFPIMAVVSIFFFLRGHNLPGGGFVAGLILAVAIIVQYMVGGTVWVENHLRMRPHRWIGLGLLVAAATGMGAWLFGYPFLT